MNKTTLMLLAGAAALLYFMSKKPTEKTLTPAGVKRVATTIRQDGKEMAA